MKKLLSISLARDCSYAWQRPRTDLAVVVNKSNPVENLTKAQLRKIVLGEQSSWPAGKRVSVMFRAPGQPERDGVFRSICSMSEDEFDQHWLHANFNGDAASPPKALATAEAVRSLVAIIPGGIGFIGPPTSTTP